MRSCALMLVVSALVIMATNSITMPENMFSGKEKLSSKYGNVKAKFTASTPKRDAAMPYAYPRVVRETRNTAITKIIGASACMLKNRCRSTMPAKDAAKIRSVSAVSFAYRLYFIRSPPERLLHYSTVALKKR